MDTKQYLINVFSKYKNIKDSISFAEKHRYCGAMECALLHLGVLSPEQKFDYEKPKKVKYFFNLLEYEEKDSYQKLIERLVEKELTTNL